MKLSLRFVIQKISILLIEMKFSVIIKLSQRNGGPCTQKNISQNGPSTIVPLLNVVKVITDDLSKAKLLNNVFLSQSTHDKCNTQLPPNPPHSKYTINQKIITPVDVYTLLVELDASKATEPDQISNHFLIKAVVPIAKSYSELFNFSLSIGEFTDI